jgi:hypothetical protein
LPVVWADRALLRLVLVNGRVLAEGVVHRGVTFYFSLQIKMLSDTSQR